MRGASADSIKQVTLDIERYLMAHSSRIHARYSDWLVPDVKTALGCVRDPLADEKNNLIADAAE